VYLGVGLGGVAGEVGHTYISNIKSTILNGGGTDTVTVDLNTGLLGHLTSSRRYKEDIKPMGDASSELYGSSRSALVTRRSLIGRSRRRLG